MKTLHLSNELSAAIFALVSLLLAPSLRSNPPAPVSTTICNYTWTTQSSGTTALLSSVKAVSESVCWIAGSNATIRRTTDGGSTWLNGNPNPGVITGNINSIEALDANNAWVASTLSTGTSIYRTTNGGANWVQVFSRTGGFIFGIHMNSGSEGIAFGDPINFVWSLLFTTNGGSNWSALPTSPPAASAASQGFKNCFQVAPPYIWFGSYPGQIMRSTNNGINWTVHSTPGIATVMAVHFNSTSLGFASSTTMVSSTDAGSTYQQHPVPGFGNISGIEGFENNIWYIRGENIYRSTNSGTSWILEHTSAMTLQAIDFPSSSSGCLTGWSVGNAGAILKMTGIPLAVNNGSGIAEKYVLYQNYPNPFNPETIISYSLPHPGNVLLEVFDPAGIEVVTLVDGYRKAGIYSVSFDASHYSSGLYLYRITSGHYTETKKMLLLK